MCPFILLTFLFSVIMLMAELTAALVSVTYNPAAVKLHEGKFTNVQFDLASTKREELTGKYKFLLDRIDVAEIDGHPDGVYEFQVPEDKLDKLVEKDKLDQEHYRYKGEFQVRAKFLGYCRIEITKQERHMGEDVYRALKGGYQLVVSVVRDKDLISKIFIYSVALVVSISYISMGCALDMDSVQKVMRRPIAPAIGIFSQYVFMPLISFLLAQTLFNETYLKLGIFVFGCSPGGGASNMWAVLLNGNLNLSITMTFLSTLFSIAIMPFWLFTLGRTIFEGTSTKPPFRNIFTTLGSMVIFLGIGLLIKRFFPRAAGISRKILAPLSGLMIIFIVIFGTYANFYMFRVMSLNMFTAAAINVWCGMFFGFALAYVFRQSQDDMLTIAIETGVQNTGVTIVVLGLSLGQPDADLASAVPVAGSLMTPIPLTIIWLIFRLRKRFFHREKVVCQEPDVGVGNGGWGQPSSSSFQRNKYQLTKDDLDDHEQQGAAGDTENGINCRNGNGSLAQSNSSSSDQDYSSKTNLKL